MWHCNFWSDYANENERFWIGGIQLFTFNTIRDIKNKLDYANYVRILVVVHNMIHGFQLDNIILSNKDYKLFDLMISEEKSQKLIKNLPSKISKYILKLWHFFY